MQLPYTYRVTQYDPRDWDETGRYTGDRAWSSAEGPSEDAHLAAVRWFADELGLTRFTVRDPVTEGLDPDEHPLATSHPLVSVFGPHLAGYHDGALVDVPGAQRLVQTMLRRAGASCRLEVEGRAFVHVWYESLYIGTTVPCPRAEARVIAAGLDCERVSHSPNDPAPTDVSPWEERRAVDAAFWTDVARLVAQRGAVMLEEWGAWTRWHRIGPGSPRAVLRPRAHVFVWPDLPTDVRSVIEHAPARDHIDCLVWVGRNGRAHQRWVGGDDPVDLDELLAGATRAMWRGTTADSGPALIEAWLPDADGVVRTRLDS